MPDPTPSLFGNGIDLLLAPDWENMGLGAAMETIWAVLRAAHLENIQAPLVINNPNPAQPAIEVQSKDPGQVPTIKVTPAGLPPVELPITPGFGGGGGTAPTTGIAGRLVTVKTIKKDTLIVNDPADPNFQGVTVAKPFALQGTQTPVAPVTSYDLTSDDAQERTAHLDTGDPIDDEDQVVVPKYIAGKTQLVILQLPVPVVVTGSSELVLTDPVTWIDMNIDARAWATTIPLDNSQPTDVAPH
jgi:hypothetical protein